ncbi:MAG: hypothetical protein ACPGMR_09825 [Pontibacterium sp.]
MVKTILGKGAAVLVMALCAYGVVNLSKIAFADVAAYQVEYAIKGWLGERRTPTPEEIEKNLKQIEVALAWEPTNPNYLHQKGLLHIYDSLKSWGTDDFLPKSQLALTTYREASRIRPMWPNTWARIAQVKAHQKVFDYEFERAIKNAVTYGPWEPQVHVTVGDAGMFGWHSLSPETQTLVAQNIYRGIKREARHLKPLADQYGVRYTVCAQMPFDQRVKDFCR